MQFFRFLLDKGYDADRLEYMKRLIDAPNSDVFDVLAYVRFTLTPLLRSERANKAREVGLAEIDGEMRSFLKAVLAAYERHGVDELALFKIGDFLRVKYGGTNGAKRALKHPTRNLNRGIPLNVDLWFILFGRMDYVRTFAGRASGAVSEVV